jgi:hypothetical protein
MSSTEPIKEAARQLDGVEVLGRLGARRPSVIMLSSVTST